jgi:Mn2+/Fe2+ NRAMP family transporter
LPYGKFFALVIIVGMALGEFVGIAGIMGVVTNLIEEWTNLLFDGNGISPIISTAVIVTAAYILFWNGKYTIFEKFLITFVIIMGLSFILSLFIIVPDPSELVKGMIPGVPEGSGSFLLIASIAGTTSGAIVFVMRSIVVSEKGWTIHNLKQARVDAFWSAFFMLILSGTIMALAAGTLYKEGTPVENAIDMVKMLVPVAGRFAISIFVVGVIAAGISTIFPISLILPWLISDYTGTKRDIKSPMYRILGGVAFILAFVVPVFGGRPVWVLVFAGALQSVVLPIATIAIFILLNNKKLMGEHKAGLWLNIGLIVSIVFAFITTYFGVVSIAGEIRALL